MKLRTSSGPAGTRWLLTIALCLSLIAAYLPVTVYAADDEMDAVQQPLTRPQRPIISGATSTNEDQQSAGIIITPADAASYFKITVPFGTMYHSDGLTEIPSGAFITASEGAAGLKFTPAQDVNGRAAFAVQAAYDLSGSGLGDPAFVELIIHAVNDPPVTGTYTDVGTHEDSKEIRISVEREYDEPGPPTALDESGQRLELIGATGNPVEGTVRFEEGQIYFTPRANFHGTATIIYTIEDSDGAANTGTILVPVRPIADVPGYTSATTLEDTQSTSGLVLNRNPADGAEVRYFQVTGITNGKLFLYDGTAEIPNGAFIPFAEGSLGLKFTPAADLNSPGTSFGFMVGAATSATGDGLSDMVFVPITVTAVNDLPAGVDDVLDPRAENSGPWRIPFDDVVGNDNPGAPNEYDQELDVASVTNAVGGTVAIEGQEIIFIPTAHVNGPASFEYTVRDSGEAPNTATAKVTFTVTEVNDAPEGVADVLSAVDEDSAPRRIAIASLLANDRPGPEGVADEEAQRLTVVSVGDASSGSVAVDGEAIEFTLAPDYNGPAGFTYTIQDNGTTAGVPDPKTDTASVTFWVNSMAERPNVTPATTAEDTKTSSGLVITPDAADGDAITHFRFSGIAGGWLYRNDGATPIRNGDYISAAEGAKGLKFMPAPDLHSPDEPFGFTVSAAFDAAGTGLSPGTSVSITVTEVNDPPIATDDRVDDIAEDSCDNVIAAVTLLANDSKGAANEINQTLSITDVSNVVGGTATVNADGDVVFTPAANRVGLASFRYTVTDDGTTAGAPDHLSGTATVRFRITPVPEEPQITVAPTAEDKATTIWVEPRADVLLKITHFIFTGAAGGLVYLDGAPMAVNDKVTVADALTKLVFAPTPDRNSVADGANYFRVSFKARDSSRNVTGPEATATVTVAEVNDKPEANDDVLGPIAEDSPAFTIAAGDLTRNDSPGTYEDGQNLNVIAVTAIDGGSVTLNEETQIITFTSRAHFHGTASFQYTVRDNGTTAGVPNPQTDTAIVSFTVTPVADAPQITPTTTAEDTQSTTGLVITRSADDGDEITHFKITAITGGRLYLNNGATVIADGAFVDAVEAGKGLRFTPTEDLNTPAGDTFGFVAQAAVDSAGTGLGLGTAASITVTEVNDAPVAVSELLMPGIAEDSGMHRIPLASLTANDLKGAANEDDQILTVRGVVGIDGGAFAMDGTDLLFTPYPNFHGNAYFDYLVEDNGTTAGVAQFKPSSAVSGILVTPLADTPTITATTTAEETQSTTGLNIYPNAVDGAEVTHFQITGIAGGKLYHSNGLTEIADGDYITIAAGAAGLKFTPAKDLNSPAGHSFTFTVKAALSNAGAGISGGVSAAITVTAVNDAPVAVDDTLPARDEDSGPWTISFSALTGNDLTGADDEDDDLTVDSVGGAVGGTVTIAGTDVIFTPTKEFNGTASLQYTVRDSGTTAGAPDLRVSAEPATVNIPVTPVNDAPVTADITLDPVGEDSPSWTIPIADVLAGDSPGPANEGDQTLTLTAVTAVRGGTPTMEGSNIRFTLTPDFQGLAEFTYTVEDTGTPPLSATATVTFTVTPAAEPPVVTPAVTAEDTQSTTGLVLTRHRADGDDVTHFAITAITGGGLYLNDGTTQIHNGDFITVDQGGEGMRFTPDDDLNTPANGPIFGFSVQGALDNAGTGISGGTSAVITVTEVNDGPTAVADALQRVLEDSGPWIIPVAVLLQNDIAGPNENGQTLTVTAVDDPTGGTAKLVGTDLVFTPFAHFHGTASFRYTVTDNGTTNGVADPKSDTAVASFTVAALNDPPIATDDTLPDPVDEDSGPLTIPFAALLANDLTGPAYEDDQTLTTVALAIDPAVGTAALSGTDVLFTPALNFNGTATFTYTVEDDGKTDGSDDPLTATAKVSITVTPVNDAPMAHDSSRSVTVGGLLRGNVTATDVDQDPLTFALVGGPTRGTVTVNPDGSYTYTSRQSGIDQFTFKANDGTVASNIATVRITTHSEPFVPVLTMSVPVTETRESSIVVTGTTNPTHHVTVNGATVMADGAGNWSATVTLVEGPNTITATMATLSRTATVVRDTRPPVIVLTASETRTEAESVVLTVTTEEGARVTIEGQATSTLTVPLGMGQNRFTATATDRLGNQATAAISVLRIGKVPPILQEIEPGRPGEATMQNFRVRLPGNVATEPLFLRVLSPAADTAAVFLAEGAAEIAGTGDSDVATQADNTPLKEVTATVTFRYDPKAVSNPADLRIYYFDAKWKVWVELGCVLNHQQNTISVQVGHFTTFAAMVPQVAAPVLPALPAEVETDTLTVTGTAPAESLVSLVINGESQVTVMTGKDGRYTMVGRLAEGRNWVYVKGTGALASREWAVTYQPDVLYTDIGGHWAEGTINRLARLRITSIYPEPLFQPDGRVTRLEFAVMVARVLGLAPVNDAPAFTDTDSMPMWARHEVAAAVKAGIIKGMPDGSFAPDALVSRAEMAVMLTRALHHAGKDVTPGDRRFTDWEQIPAWALDQVLTAARYGLITGYPDGSFQPANTTTRAEAVTMLGRLLDQVASEGSGM